jgi:hypothetical protein
MSTPNQFIPKAVVFTDEATEANSFENSATINESAVMSGSFSIASNADVMYALTPISNANLLTKIALRSLSTALTDGGASILLKRVAQGASLASAETIATIACTSLQSAGNDDDTTIEVPLTSKVVLKGGEVLILAVAGGTAASGTVAVSVQAIEINKEDLSIYGA